METIFILMAVGTTIAVLVGVVLGISAFFSQRKLQKSIQRQGGLIENLAQQVRDLEGKIRTPTPEKEAEAKGPVPDRIPMAERVPEKTGRVDVPPPPAPSPPPPMMEPPPAARTTEPKAKRTRPPQWENLEAMIGKRWMTWVGALVLFLSAAFFVKYAFDNQWLGPTARVVLGLIAGVALLIPGDRFVRKEMRALGQGLLGAGLAILYVSLFAGLSFYGLYSPTVAFFLLAAVTVAGMTLAVLHNSITISILAVLGGFLTPVLVSTGQDARDALFTYLLLLNLGVMGVAFFKRFRSLDVLAFVGTWALFSGWYGEFYQAPFLVPALLWLGVFYLVFLVLPFVHHLRKQTEITVERFLMALVNAAVVFAYAYKMLKAEHTHVLGFVALFMCAGYIILGSLTRKRLVTDARAMFGFMAMAVAFLTIAIPLHLRLQGITLAWTIEAPVLLYLGYRYKYTPARAFAGIVLLIAIVRCLAELVHFHSAPFVPVFNARFGSAVFVPLGAGLFAYVAHRFTKEASNLDRLLKYGAGLLASYLALFVFYQEARFFIRFQEMEFSRRIAKNLAGIAVWSAGGALFLAAGVRARSLPVRLAGLFALVIAAWFGLAAFGKSMGDDYILVLNARFLLVLFTVVLVFANAHFLRREEKTGLFHGEGSKAVLAWSGIAGLFLLVSAEAYTYWPSVMEDIQKARYAAQMSLTIAWGGFAIIGLVIGFAKSIRSLRLAMLALFGLTALKLVLLDTSNVKQLYRIVLFVILGLLMIGASYLYHLAEKRFGKAGEGVTE